MGHTPARHVLHKRTVTDLCQLLPGATHPVQIAVSVAGVDLWGFPNREKSCCGVLAGSGRCACCVHGQRGVAARVDCLSLGFSILGLCILIADL